MRVVLMGSPQVVVPAFEKIIHAQDSHEMSVCGVVTQAAKPQGRKKILTQTPVAQAAQHWNVPLFETDSVNDPEVIKKLEQLEGDLFVTAAFGQILKENFLSTPKRATVNIHPSLLPKFRGATPVQSALLEGCAVTGVSLLFTVASLDAGNIIAKRERAVSCEDSQLDLMEELFLVGADLFLESLGKLSNSSFCGEPQNNDEVSYCRKISKKSGQIDWRKSAQEVVWMERAYRGWPGVFTFFDGKRILLENIYKTDETVADAEEVGAFGMSQAENALLVACSDGFVKIPRIKPEGKSFVDAKSFFNGISRATCPKIFGDLA